MLVVIVIIGILSSFAILGLMSRKYDVDDEAQLMLDFFKEARQRSLTQRRTLRVELNSTDSQLRIIDENVQSDVNDDTVVRTLQLSNRVVVGEKPATITNVPTTTSPIPAMVFSQSTYPLSNNDQTFTLRFLRNGQVVDKGTNSTGSGAVVTGATIYVYNTQNKLYRAITIIGTTGETDILKCQFTGTNCSGWVR